MSLTQGFSSLELAELCGSEWFTPHVFAAMLLILCPSSPWVWKRLGLTWGLFELCSDSSCSPRCLSDSSRPRSSSLEENSGGKPIPGALQRLWEEHPKEPLVLVGSGLAGPAQPHLDTPHTLSRAGGSILKPALSPPSPLSSEWLCLLCINPGSLLELSPGWLHLLLPLWMEPGPCGWIPEYTREC